MNGKKRPTVNRWRKQAGLVCLSTLVVLIMGLGSILTFVPQATAKQQDCPFGKVWSDEQGKCITFVLTERDEGDDDYTPLPPLVDTTSEETPTPIPPIVIDPRDDSEPTVEIPILTPTPEVTPIPSVVIDIPSSTLLITKHGCPQGYDASSEDYYDLAANCHEDGNGIGFIVSDGASAVASQTTGDVTPSGIQIDGLAAAPYSIVEQVPAGYSAPIVFCDGFMPGENPQNGSKQQVLDGNQIFWVFQPGENLYCDWFNVPAGDTQPAVEIIKRACPLGFDAATADLAALQVNCHDSQNGVIFIVSDGASAIATGATGDQFDSGVAFGNLPVGPVSIVEQVPAGYGAPRVFCGKEFRDGQEEAASGQQVLDGNQIFHLFTGADYTLLCFWFNVPETDGTPTTDMPGDITIYKWECPAGYDPDMPGANPEAECVTPMNGVTFIASNGNGYAAQTMTGDSIPGAVFFGGLNPGDYSINEAVPDGYAQPFVSDCTGSAIGMIHPYPLSTGDMLVISVASGDQIVCNWYNVPMPQPQTGQITLVKYACTTATYVSDVDCEVYENGVTFDLLTWDGNQWVVAVANSTTDAYGKIVWSGLPAGSYVIDEHGSAPCLVTATYQDGSEHIAVLDGQNTTVVVYNCGAKPGKPGKPPVKYPNTGVAPAEAAASAASNAPICSAEMLAARSGMATPAVECERGSVPVSIEIDAIGVDAEIEMLETVAGEMQAPTSAESVAWYRETSRLGESGNIVLAGHLNYWGVPEGVFFKLDALRPGDLIEVTGQDGTIYTYEVVSVEALDASQGPADAVAPTDEETLTLITCGGDWNASAGEYDHRTVVHAVRV